MKTSAAVVFWEERADEAAAGLLPVEAVGQELIDSEVDHGLGDLLAPGGWKGVAIDDLPQGGEDGAGEMVGRWDALLPRLVAYLRWTFACLVLQRANLSAMPGFAPCCWGGVGSSRPA